MLITIGRQYGAGGREVAEILAKELQIPLYDRKLIALIAEHLEKGCNLEELNLTYTNLYGDESPYEHIFDNVVQNEQLFDTNSGLYLISVAFVLQDSIEEG